MTGWQLTLLIACVLGMIIGNIMLLKHTAGFKLDKRIDELKNGKKIEASEPGDDNSPPSKTGAAPRSSKRI